MLFNIVSATVSQTALALFLMFSFSLAPVFASEVKDPPRPSTPPPAHGSASAATGCGSPSAAQNAGMAFDFKNIPALEAKLAHDPHPYAKLIMKTIRDADVKHLLPKVKEFRSYCEHADPNYKALNDLRKACSQMAAEETRILPDGKERTEARAEAEAKALNDFVIPMEARLYANSKFRERHEHFLHHLGNAGDFDDRHFVALVRYLIGQDKAQEADKIRRIDLYTVDADEKELNYDEVAAQKYLQLMIDNGLLKEVKADLSHLREAQATQNQVRRFLKGNPDTKVLVLGCGSKLCNDFTSTSRNCQARGVSHLDHMTVERNPWGFPSVMANFHDPAFWTEFKDGQLTHVDDHTNGSFIFYHGGQTLREIARVLKPGGIFYPDHLSDDLDKIEYAGDRREIDLTDCTDFLRNWVKQLGFSDCRRNKKQKIEFVK